MTTQSSPRTPNLALRRARQSMRLSQAQFADAIRAAGNAMGVPNHCTKRLVQKWETGEHAACRPDYLRVLQAVTGLSALELGFRILPDESGEAVAGSEDADSSHANAARPGVRALSMPGTPEYYMHETVEASMDRLRHALEHPSRADFRTAEYVEVGTARLFELEHHSPARLLVPTLERHLALATGLLTAASHDGVRRKLMISSGHTALLAGYLAFDRGDAPSANRYWDTAMGTAEATRNEALLTGTLTYQSYAAARRGDLNAAWQLAHAASVCVKSDPRAAAWTATRVALYAAQLEERGTAEKAMQRAMELGGALRNPGPGDETAPWLSSFDRASLLSSIAHTAALMKTFDAAAHAAQAVESLNPGKVKSRAIVLAECALVAAMTGELDLCLDWGSAAARLARELDVSLATDLLYEIVPIVLPYSDTRTVRELMPHLARLRRSADLEGEATHRTHAEATNEDNR